MSCATRVLFRTVLPQPTCSVHAPVLTPAIPEYRAHAKVLYPFGAELLTGEEWGLASFFQILSLLEDFKHKTMFLSSPFLTAPGFPSHLPFKSMFSSHVLKHVSY